MVVTAGDILDLMDQAPSDMFIPSGHRGALLKFDDGNIWLMWFPTDSEFDAEEQNLAELIPGLKMIVLDFCGGRLALAARDEFDLLDSVALTMAAGRVIMTALADQIKMKHSQEIG